MEGLWRPYLAAEARGLYRAVRAGIVGYARLPDGVARRATHQRGDSPDRALDAPADCYRAGDYAVARHPAMVTPDPRAPHGRRRRLRLRPLPPDPLHR